MEKRLSSIHQTYCYQFMLIIVFLPLSIIIKNILLATMNRNWFLSITSFHWNKTVLGIYFFPEIQFDKIITFLDNDTQLKYKLEIQFKFSFIA